MKQSNLKPFKTAGHGPFSRSRILVMLAMSAALTVAAQSQTPVFTNVWVVAPGAYADLPTTGNNVRSVAISPVTTNVLYFSSTGGTNNGNSHVATLDFASGSNYLANLESTGVSGGTVGTEGVRISDDGYVYASNLSGSPASNFKIYRWPSDTDTTTSPTIVFDSGPGTSFQWRIGDYMDLRGSGINTEIIFVGAGSGANITTNLTIFRPTDDSATVFTNFSITIPGSTASLNLCGAGVTFEGTNNAIWIRRAGSQETRRVAYDPVNLTAVVTRTNNVDQSVCQGLKYYKDTNGVAMLATVQASTAVGGVQVCRVFNVTASGSSGTFVSVLSASLNVPGFANGNGLGNVDFQKGYFVFGAPNNGIALYRLGFVTQSPPSTTLAVSAATIVAGYPVTFTATSSGSTPLSYQWFFNTNTLIPAAVTNIFTLPAVTTADAGVYTVIVTNLYGATTNSVTINVLPNGGSTLASNLWSLIPGSRPYLTTGDTQRGLADDTNLDRLVLVTRSPTNGIILLDAATGADAGSLDISALLAVTPPGTFPINMCGVADDGVVYVGNLITSADADTFAIYTWTSADPSATIGQAYVGNPLGDVYPGSGSLGRIGDTMAVRGSGLNTEIICTFRNGTNVCIFTTADGVNFTPNIIAITNLAASAGLTDPFSGASPVGLGVAWGVGNTFWGKSTAYNLRQVSFDLTAGTGDVLGSYPLPSTEAPLGVDNVNGYAAVIGVNENPVNLPIYDLTTPAGPSLSTLLDREFFGINNPNGNGTGSVAFDVAGGRLFSLSSNDGILALTYAPRLFITPFQNGSVLQWSGPGTLQGASAVTGPWINVSSSSPYTSTAAAQMFFRVTR